jgi:hypothetical protein
MMGREGRMMIDETVFYLGITLALAAMLFVFGLLFHALCRHTESPVYRTALRMRVFTYCFFGLVNVPELTDHVSRPDTDNVLMLLDGGKAVPSVRHYD